MPDGFGCCTVGGRANQSDRRRQPTTDTVTSNHAVHQILAPHYHQLPPVAQRGFTKPLAPAVKGLFVAR
jgi:hypothetical protein